MDLHDSDEFVVRIPILPKVVAVCEGIPRASWHRKPIVLRNEAGDDVVRGVCQPVDVQLIIDIDRKSLGYDYVAIQIAQFLCKKEVSST